MKIISIRFKNINSLKGEHQIRFDKYPLQDSGIFAITGPTGSGKSTLLDVITLALFNQIPRLPKVSKTEITKSGSVVTHNCKEAFAQITYRVKNNEYTSVWSISQTKKGAFKDYEMTLFKPDGIPFDLKKSEIPAQNEVLIGLKYQQFIKAILLSQGEFARFLKAKKNERGKLLEDITGTDIYRHLGELCHQTYKNYLQELEQKRQEWEVIEVLSKDAVKELKNDQVTYKQQVEQVGAELTRLQKAVEIKQTLLQFRQNLSVAQQNQIKLDKELRAFQPDAERLKKHNELQELAVDFSQYQQTKVIIKSALNNQVSLKESLAKASNQLQHILQETTSLVGANVQSSHFVGQINAFYQEVSSLDNALDSLKDKGKTERQRVNQAIASNRLNIDTKEKPLVAIQVLNQRINQAKKSLSENGIKSYNLDQLEQLKALVVKFRGDLLFMNEWMGLLKQIKQIEQDTQVAQQQQQQLVLRLASIKPLLQEKQKVQNLLIQQLDMLQLQKDTALKQASMEAHRAALKPGEACPLCGSEAHPFVVDSPPLVSIVETQLNKCQESLQLSEQELKALEKQEIEQQSSLKYLQAAIKDLSFKKKQLNNQLEAQKELYQEKDSLPQQVEEGLIQRLKIKIEKQEALLSTLQALRLQEALLSDFEKLQTILEQHADLYQKRKAIYRGNSIKDDCQQLEKEFNAVQMALLKANTGIDKEIKIVAEHQLRLEKLQKLLSVAIKQYNLSSIEVLNELLLAPEFYKTLTQKKESFTIQKTQIATAIQHSKEQIEKDLERDKYPDIDLEQLNNKQKVCADSYQQLTRSMAKVEAQIDRDSQDRIRIEKLKKASTSLSEKVAKWKKMDLLIGDAKGNNFSNFAQALTLQNLLVYANKRIQKLTDRYLIVPPEKEGTLRVLDLYHGNISRSVATLSGGETFLVSLALALSLSDMASKTVSIDSLFIDEGFSTLDKDAQQMALDTLDNLQSVSQKTIGVISHVEALKSRINVQIQLDKNAQGYSSLKVSDGSAE